MSSKVHHGPDGPRTAGEARVSSPAPAHGAPAIAAESVGQEPQVVCDGDRRRARLVTLSGLALVVVLTSLLRLYRLGDHSLWYDEVASVRYVRYILGEPPYGGKTLLDLLQWEKFPPLYFLSLLPLYVSSDDEGVLRLASVIWGIATVPLVYALGARLFDERIGLIAAFLLGLSPLHIYYSQELRPYSLFTFLAVLAFYFAHLALEQNRTIHYVGLIAASVLGLYAHTYMVLPLAAINLYFVLRYTEHRHRLAPWLRSQIVVAALSLPVFYQVLYHVAMGDSEVSDYPVGLRTVASTLYVFTMGTVFFPTKANLPLLAGQGLVFGAGVSMGLWALWRERSARSGRRRIAFVLACGMTYAVIWLVSIAVVPLFDEGRIRYVLFLLPVYYYFAAKGWVSLRGAPLRVSAVALAGLLSLASLHSYYFDWDRVGKGSFRAGAEFIRSNLQESGIVYHTNRQSLLPFNHYLGWQVPQVNLAKAGTPELGDARRIWLVILKQTGGLDFGQRALEDGAVSEASRDRAIAACSRYADEWSYDLVDLREFPGKNGLVVCFYQKRSQSVAPRAAAVEMTPTCQHVIGPEVKTADGAANYSAVQPGDTVCIEAGARGPLRLKNFRGAPDKPVTFANSGGVVTVENSTSALAGVHFTNSEHVRLTGSGVSSECGALFPAEDQRCGIRVFGGNRGVAGRDKTGHIEVDHVEIGQASQPAIHINSDVPYGEWTQYDTYIHHNYVHDVPDDEAMYIGKNDTRPSVYSVLRGVDVSYNLVARTGRDGIQVSSAVEDCRIHHNTVSATAQLADTSQISGIVTGNTSVCDVYDNLVVDVSGLGIFVYANGNRVYNNVIVRPGRLMPRGSAFGAGIKLWPGATRSSAYAWNNTIVDPTAEGIRFRNDHGADNRIQNNIVVNPGSSFINTGGRANVAISHNLLASTAAEVKFANPDEDDYSLRADSPAIRSGIDLSAEEITADARGRARPAGAAFDVGALQLGSDGAIRVERRGR